MKRIFYVILLLLMTVGITSAANYPYVSQQGNGIVWINFISPQNSTLACIWQIKQDGTEYLSQCVRTTSVGAYAAQVPLDDNAPTVAFSDRFRIDQYPNGSKSSVTIQQYQDPNPKARWINSYDVQLSIMPRSSTVTSICFTRYNARLYGTARLPLGCLAIQNRVERATLTLSRNYQDYTYKPEQDDVYLIEQNDQEGNTQYTVQLENTKPVYVLPLVVK